MCVIEAMQTEKWQSTMILLTGSTVLRTLFMIISKLDAIKFMKFLSIVIIGETLDPSSRRRDVRAS